MGETIWCFMDDIKISMTLKWWIDLLLVLDNNGWNHLMFYVWYQDSMILKWLIELLLVLDNNGWNHLVFYVWYQDYYDIKLMNRFIISSR